MLRMIADRLMALAAGLAPRDRRELVTAMRHEMSVLDTGRLVWALGCLWATARWRAVDAAPFGLALVAAGLAFDAIEPGLLSLFGRHLPGDTIYVFWLATPAIVCAALAAWRPAYALAGAVGFWVVLHLSDILLVTSSAGWEILDAPPVVGWSAQLGWCLLAAWFGQRLAADRPESAARD